MPTENLSTLAVFTHLPLFPLAVTQIDGRSRAFYVAKELVDSERLWVPALVDLPVVTAACRYIKACCDVLFFLLSSCPWANLSSCMQSNWQPITQVSCETYWIQQPAHWPAAHLTIVSHHAHINESFRKISICVYSKGINSYLSFIILLFCRHVSALKYLQEVRYP